MPECTPELTILITRMTETIEKLVRSRNFIWISAGFSLLGVIIGFFLSFGMTWWDNLKKKWLIYYLLNDEICKRWNNEIKVCLFANFSSTIDWKDDGSEWGKLKSLENVSKTPISPGDFPIIENFSHSFDQYTFIHDKTLVSSLIFSHIRLHDLFDCQKILQKLVDDMRNVSSEADLSLCDKTNINKVAKNFKGFLDQIDKVLDEDIRPKLDLP